MTVDSDVVSMFCVYVASASSQRLTCERLVNSTSSPPSSCVGHSSVVVVVTQLFYNTAHTRQHTHTHTRLTIINSQQTHNVSTMTYHDDELKFSKNTFVSCVHIFEHKTQMRMSRMVMFNFL